MLMCFQNNELNVSKNCSNGHGGSQEKRSSYRAREIGALEIAAEQVCLPFQMTKQRNIYSCAVALYSLKSRYLMHAFFWK